MQQILWRPKARIVIEIPGLVIREQIAQTALLDTYRATRSSDNRVLVVKVARTDVRWPTGAKGRLLTGAKLHAKVKHQNVVPLFHFGIQDDAFYTVEGYISGPDLLQQLEQGISLDVLTEQLVGIAKGLSAVHALQIVHGDLKPEHIKIRGNGIPQILDFGFACQPLSSPANWGTPGYLAPEQLNQEAIDARTDLFSLGVVLFRCLTGYLPYGAQPTAAPLDHDRVPRLPDHFAKLQTLVDQAIAPKPEDRFQTAEAFAQALRSGTEALASNQRLPQIRSQPISTRELRDLNSSIVTPLDTGRQQRRSQQKQRKRTVRKTSIIALVLTVVGAGAYYIDRNELVSVDTLLSFIGVVEDPLLANAWNEAQSLSEDSNQDLAAIVAGYRRVLAIDAQHSGAQERLSNLEADWKQNVRTDLEQGNIEAVATRLDAAKSAFVDDVVWLDLRTQLTNRQRAQRIVKSTELLLTSHGLSDLPSATAAIQSYQEVLRLWPNHQTAQTALKQLAEHYASLANSAMSEGRLSDGISLLERATAADNSVLMLDEVRKRISQATTAREAIDDLLQQARRFRSEGQLMLPPGENAAELYHRVLATDPRNAIASQGLIEITSQVAENAELLLSEGRLDEVDLLVSQAQAAVLVEDGVAEIRRRADAERLRQDTIQASLDEARSLIARGYFTAPLDNNAVAKLREVQQIDPGNQAANEMLKQCAQKLAAVAVEANEFGFTNEAKQYLDLALAITPDVTAWIALREGWQTAEAGSE